MKFSEGLQKLLPFGYLFLVIMGILKESVFFYQIGINILKYSTIMDILVSRIATLTSNPLILLAVVKIAPMGAIKQLELTTNKMFDK